MSLANTYGIMVKHGGTDITHHVVSYNWSKKVCTGIGVLTVVIENSIINTIDISDVITIYENSALVFTATVVKTSDNYEGTATLECQDKSKYLVDYFVAESYLIDYASYTRPWIEQFLTEAQVSYSFLTEENGTLLSNNTSLGMGSAYDIIMNLLQQSGWYIEFNASGTALIGKLTSQVSNGVSVDKDRITDIEVIRDDKMLRNRAVVWGNANPDTGLQVYADIYRPTPWDIDSNDQRAFLIANSNIPNSYVANYLGNLGLDEFAKITEEKHLTIESLLNVSFATRVYIESDVFNGSGIVTTYGTSLDSSNGLRTNIVLDERCPRLFGAFYNFGDYVYIGTDGAGIKRKQIESGTWFDFSTGINDLHISDISKDKDLLVCVTVSGEAYRTYGVNSSWIPITFSGLTAYIDEENPSVVIASGLMARACTIDKTNGNIRLLVDNANFPNDLYEYRITERELFTATSGAGSRAWVLDYTANGTLVSQNQIFVAGENEYTYAGADIDNSGANDYVSVVASGSRTYLEGWRDYGSSVGRNDMDSYVHVESGQTVYKTSSMGTATSAVSIYNNEGEDEHEVVYAHDGTFTIKNAKTGTVTNKTGTLTNAHVEMAVKSSANVYEFYGRCTSGGVSKKFCSIWNTSSNTLTETVFDNPPKINNPYCGWQQDTAIVDGVGYVLAITGDTHQKSGLVYKYANGAVTYHALAFDVVGSHYPNQYGVDQQETVEIFSPSIGAFGGSYAVFAVFVLRWYWRADWGPGLFPWYRIWSDEIQVCINSQVYEEVEKWELLEGFNEASWHETDSSTMVKNGITYEGTGGFAIPLTRYSTFWDGGVNNMADTDPIVGDQYLYWSNGWSLNEGRSPLQHDWWSMAFIGGAIGGMYGALGTSVVHYRDNLDVPHFVYLDADSLSPIGEITPITYEGSTYTLTFPFSTVDTEDGEVYWLATSNSVLYLVKVPLGTLEITSVIANVGYGLTSAAGPNCGNIFIIGSQVVYLHDDSTIYTGNISKVLKRTGSDYTLIRESIGNANRLEISQDLLMLMYPERALQSMRIWNLGSESYMSINTSDAYEMCFDSRYAWRQTDFESNANLNILYTSDGYLKTVELDNEIFINPSGNWTGEPLLENNLTLLTISGIRFLETTNYKYPYQYIFAASSGNPPSFMQQNDSTIGFVDYSSGLPESRITIIRIDDEM